MSDVTIDLVPLQTIFSRADSPSVRGVKLVATGTDKDFKRGQMLFKNTAGDFSNKYSTTYNTFAGICINDYKVKNGNEQNVDLYTGGFFLGKVVFDLQTAETQTHLTTYATAQGAVTPYTMQYEKTINFEISH